VRYTFGAMNTHLSEALDGVEIMKGAAQEGAETETFITNARKVRDFFVRQGDIEARFLPMLWLGLAYAAGLFHALYLFRLGWWTPAASWPPSGLLRMLDSPPSPRPCVHPDLIRHLRRAASWSSSITRQTWTRIPRPRRHSRRDRVPGCDIPISRRSRSRPPRESGTRQASASRQEPVLKDISFSVKPGQTVAIVGQTGSGKTSLVRLVNRTYDAEAGQVLVDGVDVRDWKLAALAARSP
jgi:ATP-binding cassette subfamily B protein